MQKQAFGQTPEGGEIRGGESVDGEHTTPKWRQNNPVNTNYLLNKSIFKINIVLLHHEDNIIRHIGA